MKKYECPFCNKLNTANKWNKSTAKSFYCEIEHINKIGMGSQSNRFICPNCDASCWMGEIKEVEVENVLKNLIELKEYLEHLSFKTTTEIAENERMLVIIQKLIEEGKECNT